MMSIFRILAGKTRGILFVTTSCLLMVGCADTQKGQSVNQGNRGSSDTISIEQKFMKDGMPVQVVFYSAPRIDLRKVPVNEIDIAVVDPKEVVALSNSGGKALASIRKMGRDRWGILLAQQEKLKILQKEYRMAEEGDPEKINIERKFKAELQKYQQNGKAFQKELEDEQKRLVNLYMYRISSAVEVVARRERLELVLDSFKDFKLDKDLLSPAVTELLKQDHRDITSEVVHELDKRF